MIYKLNSISDQLSVSELKSGASSTAGLFYGKALTRIFWLVIKLSWLPYKTNRSGTQ